MYTNNQREKNEKRSLSLSTVVFTIPDLKICIFVWIRRDKEVCVSTYKINYHITLGSNSEILIVLHL